MATVVSPADGDLTASRKAPASPRTPPAAKPDEDPNALAPNIYGFIIRHSLSYQLFLILLTLISFPFLYLSLELPKTIINRAIGGKQFPQTVLDFEFDQVT